MCALHGNHRIGDCPECRELKSEMNIVNLTPHPINIVSDDGEITHTFPPSGDVLRLETQDFTGTHGMDNRLDSEGVPNVEIAWGSLGDQPQPEPDTRYIVSLPCILAQPRLDYLVPFDEVRDEAGRIVGCRALARSAHVLS